MVINQAFNGAGDTKTTTYINLFVFWVLQIPLASVMAKYLYKGPTSVYIAIAVSESLLAIVSIMLFKRGKWKLVKV